jgi:hypothetical protein
MMGFGGWQGIALTMATAIVAGCSAGDGEWSAGNPPSDRPATKSVSSRGVDADGNGRADILLVGNAGRMLLWSMNGARLESQSDLGTIEPGWRVVDASGDYNGDGRTDILWRHTDGTLRTWLMNGATVLSSTTLGTVENGWQVADGRGDYDGDGRSDILWRHTSGTVAIWRMDGATRVSAAFPATVPADWRILDGSGDYDGDGRSDVLWRNDSGVIAIWRMNGASIQAATFLPGVGAEWSAVDGTGDHDGDGRSDILWRSTSGQVVAWFMNVGVRETALLGSAGAEWRALDASGDYDGDGRSDILWQSVTGQVLLWTINATQRTGATPVGMVGAEWQVAAGSGARPVPAPGEPTWPPGGVQAVSRPPFRVAGFNINMYGRDRLRLAENYPSLDRLVATGSNTVMVTVPYFQTDARASDVGPDPVATETDANLAALFDALRARGFSVAFKFTVIPKDDSWSGAIEPADVAAWFAAYRSHLVRLAALAQAHGVTTLYIANEMQSMAQPRFVNQWSALVDSVRAVFSGRLGWNAVLNARGFPDGEAFTIPVASRLDEIGLSIYEPLTASTRPSVDELVRAWRSNRNGHDLVAMVRAVHTSTGKPVVFSEITYRSVDGNNMDPSDWMSKPGDIVDAQEQADCYEAFMRVWTAERADWMHGVLWWQWLIEPSPERAVSHDQTPQNLPAEAVVTGWFTGRVTP